jgi:hypothetical protein
MLDLKLTMVRKGNASFHGRFSDISIMIAQHLPDYLLGFA